MPTGPDAAESAGDSPESPDADAERSGFDAGLLSDLFVNAVPIVIIAAFVVAFGFLSPVGGRGDPLVLFHGALVGGVVLVSVVAGWVIARQDDPLEGSAARSFDDESERD
ncbi:MAG: DUF6684 family protein [Halolamina sp.]